MPQANPLKKTSYRHTLGRQGANYRFLLTICSHVVTAAAPAGRGEELDADVGDPPRLSVCRRGRDYAVARHADGPESSAMRKRDGTAPPPPPAAPRPAAARG